MLISGSVRSCSECGLSYRSLAPRCGLDGAPIVQTEHDLLIGRSIGPYLIQERLGEGGYAVLYRVQDDRGDAAVELLLGEMACLPPLAERFRREALAMRRIDHPNVARVHDFGRTERGLSYLVMELLTGKLLARELERGPFPRERAIGIGIDLARGLAAAHAVGCIHRDVTPRNIMLMDGKRSAQRAERAETGGRASPGRDPRDGSTKLFDFGLVALSDPDDSRSQVKLTDLGTVVGTPEYVAPEVGFGHAATARSDLYSLGVVLYEMRMGRPPFTGKARDIFAAHLLETVPPFEETGDFESLVLELLSSKPERRPDNAGVVAERLSRM